MPRTVFEGRELYGQACFMQLHRYIHKHRTADRYEFYEIGLAEENNCVIPSLMEESVKTLHSA